jgi:SAM-dependent methyltransferase
VLEIGAGGAAMATRLLATFPDVRLVVTGYDPDIVAAAQATLPPFKDRASTQRVAAAAVPFADGRFNLVLSFGMLHHVIDRERALAEAVRVLRPGGELVGYDLLDAAPFRLMHRGAPSHTRMIRPDQLAAELARHPSPQVRTRRSPGNLALRFAAIRLPERHHPAVSATSNMRQTTSNTRH